MTTLNFIPFDEWLERNTDVERETECVECGGSGSYECDCEHCRGHECEECDGTGRMDNPAARKIYEAECKKALALLAAQRGGEGEG